LAVLVCGLGICFAVADNLQPGNPQDAGNPTEEELAPPKEPTPVTPPKTKAPKKDKKKAETYSDTGRLPRNPRSSGDGASQDCSRQAQT
jgi:hypothetical protein